jgi:hypothetical protein
MTPSTEVLKPQDRVTYNGMIFRVTAICPEANRAIVKCVSAVYSDEFAFPLDAIVRRGDSWFYQG